VIVSALRGGKEIMSRAEIARDRLFANVRTLVEDVEELLKATAEQTGDGMSTLRDRLLQTLESGKTTLAQSRRALQSSRRGADAAISYAQDNPRTAVGVALCAGLALGLLLWSKMRE
jgi:ElaB/YqjD/DUF883 family membrane-anchored ribosome-binding protein